MAFDKDELNNRRAQREKRAIQRQQEQKKLMLRLIIALIVLAVCAVVILVVVLNRGSQPTTPTDGNGVSSTKPTGTDPIQTQPKPTEPTTVIHIAAAGDLNVTDGTVAAGNRTGIYDYSSVFLDVAPLLAGADLTVMNFEGNLVGSPYGSENVSAPQQMVQALSDAGVDLLQMANSWAIRNGILGLQSTLSGIRSAGIEPLGAYADAEEFESSRGYYIREVQGIRIAFVAFTKGMDNMGLPAGSEDCVNLLYTDYSTTYKTVDTEGITQVLQNVAEEAPDLTIALLHWGSEYNDNISSTQEKIVKLMAEQGVDAIIGSHSHLVQKMGFHEDHGIFVAYSLGDFFGDGTMPGTSYSLVLDLEITRDNATGETTITGYDYTPIYTVPDAETGAPTKVLRIRQAIAAYENSFVGMVDAATYQNMVTAMTRIEQRVNGE